MLHRMKLIGEDLGSPLEASDETIVKVVLFNLYLSRAGLVTLLRDIPQ